MQKEQLVNLARNCQQIELKEKGMFKVSNHLKQTHYRNSSILTIPYFYIAFSDITIAISTISDANMPALRIRIPRRRKFRLLSPARRLSVYMLIYFHLLSISTECLYFLHTSLK